MKNTGRLRAVFDCNVFLQALAFPDGPAARCLASAERGDVELVISRPTYRELSDVLDYPVVRSISPRMTDEAVSSFLARVSFRATLIRRVPHKILHSRDPKDEIYLDLALAARADFLVTRDNDLLDLTTSRSVAAKEFRSRTHPLAILDPVAFLEAIEQQARDWS